LTERYSSNDFRLVVLSFSRFIVDIQQNISLKPYNTFAVDVQADFFVEIKDEQELFDLISTDVFAAQPHLILWWGANILFTKDYKWLVIKISLLGKEVIKQEGNTVCIKAGAWEVWHDLMMRTLGHGFVWWENLVFIPGQVGAAPVGNIGAFGKEAEELIYEAEGMDLTTKKKKTRTNSDCKFGYRDSIFKNELKNKVIITAVTFVFEKDSADYIPNTQYNDIQDVITQEEKSPLTIATQDVARIITDIRKRKLPDRTKVGTAWSFFKNPVVGKDQFEKLLVKYPQLKWNSAPNGIKLSAGQLVELAGYKGKSEWRVGTYENHALIIVNNGGASGAEIRAFAQSIQKKVLELFDVTLESEVIIM